MVNKIAVIIAAVALVTATIFGILTTKDLVATPRDESTIVVGVNTPFPPFEDRKGEEVVGFDIDVVKLVAREAGKTLVIKDFQDFYALLPALVAGKLDMVISAVSITPEREEIVSFSQPYFSTSQAILAKVGTTIDANNLNGLIVGYQEGTTSEEWVKANLAVSDSVTFGELSLGIQYLKLGNVDVILVDRPVAEAFASRDVDIIVIGNIETGEVYGVAVQKGDPKELLPLVNGLMGTQEYEELVNKWFGGEND